MFAIATSLPSSLATLRIMLYTTNPLELNIEDVRSLTIRDERRRIHKSVVGAITYFAKAAKKNAWSGTNPRC